MGAEVADQAVDRSTLGRSHVSRRDDAERRAPTLEATKLLLKQAQSVPLHESAQQVDFVGGVDLSLQLGTETRFAIGVGQQSGIRQRCARPRVLVGRKARPRPTGNTSQLSGWDHDLLAHLGEFCRDPIGERYTLFGLAECAQGTNGLLVEIPGEHVWLISVIHLRCRDLKIACLAQPGIKRVGQQRLVEPLRPLW